MTDVLSRELRDGVAWLRMNRPEKRNAFNRELALAVTEQIDELAADDGVRVIVLTGAGSSFC
ncbi:MAG: enoyl-CoA hydratase/isomerase family protein, partial [Chloroflexi bacterium]|nr:enoyl-CoA hydratase/isomerase family protein [Chloroflexota bacterium]